VGSSAEHVQGTGLRIFGEARVVTDGEKRGSARRRTTGYSGWGVGDTWCGAVTCVLVGKRCKPPASFWKRFGLTGKGLFGD
jgi:hypothetical protein